MRAILLICLLAVFTVSTTASAQNRKSHLSCGSVKGLVENVLSKLTAMTQLLNNSVGQTVSSKDLRRGFCDYKQFASGSVGVFDGIFVDSDSNLAYVIYKVSTQTTNAFTGQPSGNRQTSFAVDAVVSANRWRVARNEECSNDYHYRGTCLVPVGCDVLNEFPASGNLLGFIDRRALPFYVNTVQGRCQQQIIR